MTSCVRGEGTRDALEAIAGELVGHNEHSRMGALIGEELEREGDKVVAVPGHEAAALRPSALELFQVGQPERADLVGTHRIHPARRQEFSELRA